MCVSRTLPRRLAPTVRDPSALLATDEDHVHAGIEAARLRGSAPQARGTALLGAPPGAGINLSRLPRVALLVLPGLALAGNARFTGRLVTRRHFFTPSYSLP
jgi:hypothetical protein